jgi:spoIIIJ-associated protein
VPDQNDKPLSDGALFVVDDDDDLDDDDEGRGRGRKESRGEPGDGKAEAAVEVLDGILARMDLDTEIGIREDGERIVLDVSGPDAGRAIGRKGQTLDALQFLVNKVVNRFPSGRRHVVVDSGDYRDRHDRGLVSLAKRQAKKAVQQGRVITLEPMSARDRRVIHLSLAKFPGVTTKSNGEGLGRRIQIIPARRRAGRPMDRGPRSQERDRD